jgi:amidophosphoribosyltransferase
MGLVADAFDEAALATLTGRSAIGQVRYSTAGSSELRNAQPFVFEYAHGGIAVAHNGNLVNAVKLRKELEAKGSIFQTSSDTEVIIHLLAQAREPSTIERLATALRQVSGAFSLVFLTETKLIAVRDPHGFRPLALGRLKDSFVISSETCSFDLIEAEYIRAIEPGEMIVIDEDGLKSYKPFSVMREPVEPQFCVFEHVYFARPDSLINGKSVYRSRIKMGRRLAQEHPVDADVVFAVPDSGVPAAIGYANASGIRYDVGLIRSHYVGRTFIEPQDSIRHFGVKLKLNPVRAVVDGKRCVVVDDSLVRGTTSRKIVQMLRNAGAREVHLRISAPPTTNPCYYGIDTPTRKELIASNYSVEEIAKYITCDSLEYLSHEGMMKAVGAPGDGTGYCSACFTGKYPVPLQDPADESGELITLRRPR